MFIVFLVRPLQVENPMKVHIHQQLLKLFQTPLSRSSFYLKITMSVPCPFVFKKKTSRLEVVQLKLPTCTSPKDISLWLCKSLQPSGRTQRKSTKNHIWFLSRQCLFFWCANSIWVLFSKHNNSRKSWFSNSHEKSTFQDPSALLPWPQQGAGDIFMLALCR